MSDNYSLTAPRTAGSIGRMRHRVRLQQPQRTIDTHGQEIVTYKTKAEVRAEITSQSMGDGLVRYSIRMRGAIPVKIDFGVKWRIVEVDTTGNAYHVKNYFDKWGKGRQVIADSVLSVT